MLSHIQIFFIINTQLQGEGPRLGDVACVVFEQLTGAQPPVALTRDSPQVRYMAEGLLGHFFSEHHTFYHESDIWWFLDIANKQSQWQTTFLMNEVIEVEYSVDLLSQLDYSPDCMSVNSSIQRIQCRVPMSVFKFYLYRILHRSIRGGDDPIHSILMHFQKLPVGTWCHHIHVHVNQEVPCNPGAVVSMFLQVAQKLT